MAITFVNKGTFTTGTGALSVPVPASYAQGDLFLLMIETANAATTTVPSGWFTMSGSPISRGTINAIGGIKFEVLYKIATASEASVSLTETGLNHRTAQITAWRGVNTTTPFDVTPTTKIDATTATALVWATITTATNNAMIINAVGIDRDGASTAVVSAWANTDLDSITERHDQTVSTGVGGGFALASGIKATAGLVKATTATEITTAGYNVFYTIALRPIDARTGTFTLPQTSPTFDITGYRLRGGPVSIEQASVVAVTGPFITIDSYGALTGWGAVSANRRIGQSFACETTSVLYSSIMHLILNTLGTGTIRMELHAHTGTYGDAGATVAGFTAGSLLASSDVIDLSTYTEVFDAFVEFRFRDNFMMFAGIKYCIVLYSSNLTASISFAIDNANLLHAGTMFATTAEIPDEALTTRTTYDVIFEVKGRVATSKRYGSFTLQNNSTIDVAGEKPPAVMPAELYNWSYKKTVTIPAAQIDADLTNFPCTIILDSTNFDFSHAKADGSDLRFTDVDYNYLKFERQEHSNIAPRAVYHVKIPTVASAADTAIYMWYGNTGASDTQDKVNVWDANYKMVLHIGASLADSTSNGHSCTPTGTAIVDTDYGKARSFNGTSGVIATTFDPSASLGSQISFIAMASPSSQANYNGLAGWQMGDGHALVFFEYAGGAWRVSYGSANDMVINKNITSLTLNAFTVLGSTIDVAVPGFVRVFNGGTVIGTDASFSYADITTTSVFKIGQALDNWMRFFEGVIGEMRISNTVRTDAWMKAESLSIGNTLITVGTEVPNTASNDKTGSFVLPISGLTISYSGKKQAKGTFSLAVAATLATIGKKRNAAGLVVLNQPSTLTYVGKKNGRAPPASIALTHATGIAFTGKKQGKATTSVAQTSTLNVLGKSVRRNTVGISTSASFTSTSKKGAKNTSTISQASTLTLTGTPTKKGVVSILQASTLNVIGGRRSQSAVTITQLSTLNFTGVHKGLGQATINQSSGLNTLGAKKSSNTFNITHSSGISFTGSKIGVSTVALSLATSLTVTGYKKSANTTSLTLATNINFTGKKSSGSVVSLSLITQVSATGVKKAKGSYSLPQVTAVSAVGKKRSTFSSVQVTGVTNISVVGTRKTSGEVIITALPVVQVLGTKRISAISSLSIASNIAVIMRKNSNSAITLVSNSNLYSAGYKLGRDATSISNATNVNTSSHKNARGLAEIVGSGNVNITSGKIVFKQVELSAISSLVSVGVKHARGVVGISSVISIGVTGEVLVSALDGSFSMSSTTSLSVIGKKKSKDYISTFAYTNVSVTGFRKSIGATSLSSTTSVDGAGRKAARSILGILTTALLNQVGVKRTSKIATLNSITNLVTKGYTQRESSVQVGAATVLSVVGKSRRRDTVTLQSGTGVEVGGYRVISADVVIWSAANTTFAGYKKALQAVQVSATVRLGFLWIKNTSGIVDITSAASLKIKGNNVYFDAYDIVRLTAVHDISRSQGVVHRLLSYLGNIKASSVSSSQACTTKKLSYQAVHNKKKEVVYYMSTDAVGDPISMVAGETRVIELRVVDSEGLSVDLEGATAVFAVEKVLEKACTITGDTLMVKILPTETSKPSVTEYEFRIRDRDTDVDSIIKGEFTILKRVVSKEWGV